MSNPESTDNQRRKILVVDDEPSIRMVLTTALRRGGDYEVWEAANGQEAKEFLERQKVDLVITDLSMPGMDGLTLMQWAQKGCPDPMWIILSGRATFDDAVRAVRLGAFDLITKPLVMLDSLLVTVRNALRQRHLIEEQRRLNTDIESRNNQLNKQVSQLKDACRMLCDQARTIGEDLRRAELIQRALLPQSAPPMEHYSADAIYRPSQKVGGDLYDVARIDNRYVVAYVADAAGHGVSAAMLAVLFKHRLHLRDETTGAPIEPAQALQQVNDTLMAECSAPGLFITAAYCLIDSQTRELIAASAGHPPLLLHRAGGEMEMIFHTGPALGLMAGARYAQIRKRLDDGDRLLLYTDGLCDSLQNTAGPKFDQISRILADRQYQGQDALHALLDTATEQREGVAQEDDITMLLLTARAMPSCLDNGPVTPVEFSQPITAPMPGSEILMGAGNGTTYFAIRGRGVWTFAAAFHDAVVHEFSDARPVTLDLATCHYLDSTCLGTLQELADRAEKNDIHLRIQGVLPEVRHLFDELEMSKVIDHIAPDIQALPAQMRPLTAASTDDVLTRRRILEAHEALAALSERNRDEFQKLIEGIRAEVLQVEGAAAG